MEVEDAKLFTRFSTEYARANLRCGQVVEAEIFQTFFLSQVSVRAMKSRVCKTFAKVSD